VINFSDLHLFIVNGIVSSSDPRVVIPHNTQNRVVLPRCVRSRVCMRYMEVGH
jgi:hypothetical protein